MVHQLLCCLVNSVADLTLVDLRRGCTLLSSLSDLALFRCICDFSLLALLAALLVLSSARLGLFLTRLWVPLLFVLLLRLLGLTLLLCV